mmetsp:Transcript_23093/g.44879  ORF Transcript_23093/g.44879 Transcript_23093/m.44879 type:complete len:107 (-) Transcript_23093:235-555(-)
MRRCQPPHHTHILFGESVLYSLNIRQHLRRFLTACFCGTCCTFFSDLLRSVDTDFLNFPANRAIERLAPSLGPPFCDAVCMEFMFTRGPTTRIRCSDLRQTDCTNV